MATFTERLGYPLEQLMTASTNARSRVLGEVPADNVSPPITSLHTLPPDTNANT